MRKIPLSNGDFALCDSEDFRLLTVKPMVYPYQRLNKYVWHCNIQGKTKYAITRIKTDRGWKTIKMHQFVMGIYGIDHKNGNGLDNRKSNLRPCTQAQNNYNSSSKKNENSNSKYKGVRFEGAVTVPNWLARISFKGKLIRIGRFKTELAAVRAYNKKAKELFGEFACLNKF